MVCIDTAIFARLRWWTNWPDNCWGKMFLMNKFEISLNGEPIQTDAPTLQDLLIARGYDLKGAFACAVNRAFVPRQQWPARTLQASDRIDVITPIAGG